MFQAEGDDAVDGGEDAAGEQRQLMLGQVGAELFQRGFDVGEGGFLGLHEPAGGFRGFGHAVGEQGVPAAAVGGGVGQVGGGEAGELLGGGAGLDGGHVAADFLQRGGVHGEDEGVEVREDVIDGADRAADGLRQGAGTQLGQAVGFDEGLGGGEKLAAEVVMALGRRQANGFLQKNF